MSEQAEHKHNGTCDVEWVDGSPVWVRALRQNGAARICSACYARLDPQESVMRWPQKTKSNDEKPDKRK